MVGFLEFSKEFIIESFGYSLLEIHLNEKSSFFDFYGVYKKNSSVEFKISLKLYNLRVEEFEDGKS